MNLNTLSLKIRFHFKIDVLFLNYESENVFSTYGQINKPFQLEHYSKKRAKARKINSVKISITTAKRNSKILST
jgi:hypothetical protein